MGPYPTRWCLRTGGGGVLTRLLGLLCFASIRLEYLAILNTKDKVLSKVGTYLNPTLLLLLFQSTPTHHPTTKPFYQSPQHTVCLHLLPRYGRDGCLWQAVADF